jgi:hypothetical protein
MPMKHIIACLLVISLAAELPSPGITPDSWFYGLDRAFEAIQKAFAFTPEAKARLALQLASERLAEAKEMEARQKPELAAKTAEDYGGEMDEALRHATQAVMKEVVEQATLHLTVLEKTMPDEALYKAKRKAEEIEIRAAETAEERARKELECAERRLEEVKQMVEKGKSDLARDVLEDYKDEINRAIEYGARIAELAKKKEFEEMVVLATSIHTETLEDVLEKAKAKQAIEDAIDASIRGQEECLDRLAKIKPERAAELCFGIAEKRLERLREEVEKGNTERVEKIAAEYERKMNKTLEFIEIANVTKIGMLLETVSNATSKHLGVLEGVWGKVPEEAKDAIEKAMNVSAKGQQKALEALEKVKPIEQIPKRGAERSNQAQQAFYPRTPQL